MKTILIIILYLYRAVCIELSFSYIAWIFCMFLVLMCLASECVQAHGRGNFFVVVIEYQFRYKNSSSIGVDFMIKLKS